MRARRDQEGETCNEECSGERTGRGRWRKARKGKKENLDVGEEVREGGRKRRGKRERKGDG